MKGCSIIDKLSKKKGEKKKKKIRKCYNAGLLKKNNIKMITGDKISFGSNFLRQKRIVYCKVIPKTKN